MRAMRFTIKMLFLFYTDTNMPLLFEVSGTSIYIYSHYKHVVPSNLQVMPRVGDDILIYIPQFVFFRFA